MNLRPAVSQPLAGGPEPLSLGPLHLPQGWRLFGGPRPQAIHALAEFLRHRFPPQRSRRSRDPRALRGENEGDYTAAGGDGDKFGARFAEMVSAALPPFPSPRRAQAGLQRSEAF